MSRWPLLPLAFALGCAPEAPAPKARPSSRPASQPTSQPASAPASRPERAVIEMPPSKAPLGVNTSGIRYRDDTCDGSAPCPCVAPELFFGLNALRKVGVDVGSLGGKGADCLLGDLDGNGHTDVLFLGSKAASGRMNAVLLHDEGGISAHLRLPAPLSAPSLDDSGNRKAVVRDGKRAFVWVDGRFRAGYYTETGTRSDP